ncbi:hypothetical protein B7494_g4650 [Chlorociboria aeruginascens]|nr:hypothetical protein B7494_g4650 [Chlorociboria aeruginascens]
MDSDSESEAGSDPKCRDFAAVASSPDDSSTSSMSNIEQLVAGDLETFPFLSLPLELRLKIYSYLLPTSTHKIITQIPHNGYFYNTSTIPTLSAQSFYPFGRKSPKSLTTYKVLPQHRSGNTNGEGMNVEILRVSKQVNEEAEEVLYANKCTVWDFGIHLDAVQGFWGDRSIKARNWVKNIRVAREVSFDTVAKDEDWEHLCTYLKESMVGLRSVDLVVWSAGGSVSEFSATTSMIHPTGQIANDEADELERKVEEERKWRALEWVQCLLEHEALRRTNITYWGFRGEKGESSYFNHWIAKKMAGDGLVRGRMLREEIVSEASVVLARVLHSEE